MLFLILIFMEIYLLKPAIDDNKVNISFIDNGKGISEEDIPRIFEKYASYAKKFKQVGTGLGLYLTKQIIELHNGEIIVESQLEKGSNFTFFLPHVHALVK